MGIEKGVGIETVRVADNTAPVVGRNIHQPSSGLTCLVHNGTSLRSTPARQPSISAHTSWQASEKARNRSESSSLDLTSISCNPLSCPPWFAGRPSARPPCVASFLQTPSDGQYALDGLLRGRRAHEQRVRLHHRRARRPLAGPEGPVAALVGPLRLRIGMHADIVPNPFGRPRCGDWSVYHAVESPKRRPEPIAGFRRYLRANSALALLGSGWSHRHGVTTLM